MGSGTGAGTRDHNLVQAQRLAGGATHTFAPPVLLPSALSGQVEYSIKVQLLEIYNETLRDLLVRCSVGSWTNACWVGSRRPPAPSFAANPVHSPASCPAGPLKPGSRCPRRRPSSSGRWRSRTWSARGSTCRTPFRWAVLRPRGRLGISSICSVWLAAHSSKRCRLAARHVPLSDPALPLMHMSTPPPTHSYILPGGGGVHRGCAGCDGPRAAQPCGGGDAHERPLLTLAPGKRWGGLVGSWQAGAGAGHALAGDDGHAGATAAVELAPLNMPCCSCVGSQVLTVMVEGSNKITHARTHGCLHLIDLAGGCLEED